MRVDNCRDSGCLAAILTPFAVVGFFLLIAVVYIAWPINKKATAKDCEKRRDEEAAFEKERNAALKSRHANVAWVQDGTNMAASLSAMSPLTGDNMQSPASPLTQNALNDNEASGSNNNDNNSPFGDAEMEQKEQPSIKA